MDCECLKLYFLHFTYWVWSQEKLNGFLKDSGKMAAFSCKKKKKIPGVHLTLNEVDSKQILDHAGIVIPTSCNIMQLETRVRVYSHAVRLYLRTAVL